jgi:LuxR family transcriptional regulator, quorum-sensing system regulator BjaR1
MSDIATVAFDLIDEFERLTRPEDIQNRMGSVLKHCGYDAFLITTVPNRLMGHRPVFMVDGWPEGWSNYYVEQGCYDHDPVASYCRVALDPFDWSDVPKGFLSGRKNREVMNVAGDFGLKFGRAIPVVRADGQVGAVTIAGDNRIEDTRITRAVHLIGLYAYSKIFDMANPQRDETAEQLSAGESEVLTWIAAGKSTWEISSILKISENTVEWRLKQAFRKLNAVSRTQAVVIALKTRQITV